MKDILFKDYNKYANFYDIFNKYRSYELESKFILDTIKNRKEILDIGCGTGKHMNILENLGYMVEGVDISPNMIKVAKTRVKGNIYNQNVLDLKLEEKYKAIIVMKSVLNHLNSYVQFEIALKNMLNVLEKNGIIIIDLDNKKINGTYEDKVDDNKRIITSKYDKKERIQYRKYSFFIGAKEFEFEHKYFIYDSKKLEEILDKFNIRYVFLTNYSRQLFSERQNRLHIIIRKL